MHTSLFKLWPYQTTARKHTILKHCRININTTIFVLQMRMSNLLVGRYLADVVLEKPMLVHSKDSSQDRCLANFEGGFDIVDSQFITQQNEIYTHTKVTRRFSFLSFFFFFVVLLYKVYKTRKTARNFSGYFRNTQMTWRNVEYYIKSQVEKGNNFHINRSIQKWKILVYFVFIQNIHMKVSGSW